MELQVAIGIITNQISKKVFISKRKDDVHMAGMWEFPGGKVNNNEKIIDALYREFKEETSIVIYKSHLFDEITYIEGDLTLYLSFFLIQEYSGKPLGKEGNKTKWVNISELSCVNMPPANKAVISKLQKVFL